jgi:hypothetical protein
MQDNERQRDPWDSERIDVGNPYDVRRWCQRFVCTEAMLRAAVGKVGADPGAVGRLVALGGPVGCRLARPVSLPRARTTE